MFAYCWVGAASAASLIWRHPLADVAAEAASPIVAAFTLLALVSGSLWGRPMWGAYWVLNGCAASTSFLLLLFLYLGHWARCWNAFLTIRSRAASRAAAILAVVGLINLPVIKWSVDWWNTLHQPGQCPEDGRASSIPISFDAASVAGDGARLPALWSPSCGALLPGDAVMRMKAMLLSGGAAKAPTMLYRRRPRGFRAPGVAASEGGRVSAYFAMVRLPRVFHLAELRARRWSLLLVRRVRCWRCGTTQCRGNEALENESGDGAEKRRSRFRVMKRRMKRKTLRLYLLVASLCLLGVAVGLTLYAFQSRIRSSSFPAAPAPTSPRSGPPGWGQLLVRLGGLVEAGSVTKTGDGATTSFQA